MLAIGLVGTWSTSRLTLPERIPDFGRRTLILFRLIWFPAFLLALAGPVAGTWYRLTHASQNSALMPGSRAGFVVADEDLTRIRFPVGRATRTLGVRAGDDIVAIDGIPVSEVVPMPGSAAARKSRATEADYALFGDLLYGTDSRDVQLRLRGSDGRERDIQVRTGESHIEQGASELGVPHGVLSFADLLHLLTYPFLLASAWVLYRRKPYDVISSVLSLAILLTLASEQPSASFLELVAGVPPALHRALYDAANMCLLAGVMMFPHGRLSPRPMLIVPLTLPLLLFLEGNVYRTIFMAYMAASVLTLVWRMKQTAPGDERQQIKWALFGFSGYAIFLAASLIGDMMKLQAVDFAQRLVLEVAAGFSFGLAFLLLQLGLLVALLRYRLYDAERVISRSASLAVITLSLGGVFAATMEGVKMVVQSAFGQSASNTAAIVGAAVSTILVNPIYEHVQRWAERRFNRKLVELQHDLPACLVDLRLIASLRELLDEVLDRVEAGVRPIHVAAIVEGQIVESRGISPEQTAAWSDGRTLDPACELKYDSSDPVFPIALPLTLDDGGCLGWILVGPRPDCSSPSGSELHALKEVADPVARGVRVVLKREARERDVSEALAHQQRQIERLEARLSIDRTGTAA